MRLGAIRYYLYGAKRYDSTVRYGTVYTTQYGILLHGTIRFGNYDKIQYVRGLFINNVDFCCENLISHYSVTIYASFCFGIHALSQMRFLYR